MVQHQHVYTHGRSMKVVTCPCGSFRFTCECCGDLPEYCECLGPSIDTIKEITQ